MRTSDVYLGNLRASSRRSSRQLVRHGSLLLATGGPFVTEEDKGKLVLLLGMLARHKCTPFFLLLGAGDTHEETNVLPISDREEKVDDS